jgi:hypothetical protein
MTLDKGNDSNDCMYKVEGERECVRFYITAGWEFAASQGRLRSAETRTALLGSQGCWAVRHACGLP